MVEMCQVAVVVVNLVGVGVVGALIRRVLFKHYDLRLNVVVIDVVCCGLLVRLGLFRIQRVVKVAMAVFYYYLAR